MDTTRRAHRRPLQIGRIVAGALVLAALIPAGSAARAQSEPKPAGQPTISGRAVEGNILTASTGAWTGTGPFNYTYHWLRCPASGSGGNGEGCTTISGATFRRYAVTSSDVGHRLRVRVTAANSEGTASETSNATGVVQSATVAGPPQNATPPTVSGTAQVGQALMATNGSWVGQAPLSYTYQWRRCSSSGASCSDISGATAKSRLLAAVDQGTTLRVRVTAHNPRGAAAATSAPSAVVVKAEAPSGATIPIDEVALPNRLIVDRVSFSPQPLRSRRTFTARFHVSDSRNHSVMGALVFVVSMPFGVTSTPAEAATGSDGCITFRMRPTRRFSFARASAGVPMFVRARRASDRLIGGVSTRRLVNLSVR
jgi:hypothetical protein